MKLSTFVQYTLIVSAVFFCFALIIGDINTAYPEAEINTSQWEDQYDYVSEINSTIYPLEQKFKVIQDENAGFFTKLTAGISAIPYAVIIVPQVIFGSLETGGNITMGFLMALAIPGYLIVIVVLCTLVWALFKLVGFFQQTEI